MTENSSTAASGNAAIVAAIGEDWEPGRTAWDAYCTTMTAQEERDGRLVTGSDPVRPSWEMLPPRVRDAFEHAAYAVLDQAGRGQSVTDPKRPGGEGAEQ